MAERIRTVCPACEWSVKAWSDGNPYLIEDGTKRYVPHPSQDWDKAVGNDVPAVCLDCGRQTTLDSRAPRKACSRCRSGRLRPAYSLAGCECPRCHDGQMARDDSYRMIS